jgi:hypothetical protein
MTDDKRFPGKKRYPRANDSKNFAGLEQLLWTAPKFQARLNRKKTAIRMVFTIPFPNESDLNAPYEVISDNGDVRTRQAASYESLLRDGGDLLMGSISRAYWDMNLKHGTKPVNKVMITLLHKTFRAGVHRWLESWLTDSWIADTWKVADQNRFLAEYKALTETKTGQKPDARVALWISLRYEKLRPGMKVRKGAHAKSVRERVLTQINAELQNTEYKLTEKVTLNKHLEFGDALLALLRSRD